METIIIGKFNELEILRETKPGLYLDGLEYGDILLPKQYIHSDFRLGDSISVFLYFDSEDRLIATTQTPIAQLEDFAFLKVVAVSQFGAFLDWGLPKDLFVPFKAQSEPMVAEKSYVVRIYYDEISQRLAASSKLEVFFEPLDPAYSEGQKVELLIYKKNDIGYEAVIDNRSTGLIFSEDIFGKIEIGQVHKGYIKKIRDDLKVDLKLLASGYQKVPEIAQFIYDTIVAAGGFMAYNDKSPPDKIREVFGMSKKNFKISLGALYKKKAITIHEDGVRIIPNS